MNIGVDFDGVIADTERYFKYLTEKYCYFELNGKEINREIKGFNSAESAEVEKVFFERGYYEKATRESPFMPGVTEVLQMLRDRGHKLFIVTARGLKNKEIEISTGKKKLEELNFVFDGVFWSAADKGKVCRDNNLAVLIDDDTVNCERVAEVGLKALHLRDRFIREAKKSPNIIEVDTFMHIYKEILKLESNN